MNEVGNLYFSFLGWFAITNIISISKDISKKDVMFRYIITFLFLQLFIFLKVITK